MKGEFDLHEPDLIYVSLSGKEEMRFLIFKLPDEKFIPCQNSWEHFTWLDIHMGIDTKLYNSIDFFTVKL